MHETLVSDGLWKIIEPLLPPDPPREKGGRPRIPNRNAFAGIVYVLKSGVHWRMLLKEIRGGSGTTCWRRLRDWQKAGGFLCVPEVGLEPTLPGGNRILSPPCSGTGIATEGQGRIKLRFCRGLDTLQGTQRDRG
jgi:transposase